MGLVWVLVSVHCVPRGSIYTPIMELGSQNHCRDCLWGPDSILVVYMDPLGSWEDPQVRAQIWEVPKIGDPILNNDLGFRV